MATDALSVVTAGESEDVFAELEEKIGRLAEALSEARSERDRAVAALRPLQTAQEKQQRALAQAEQELVGLRKERQDVRGRVGKLIKQLEGAGA